LWRKKEKKKVSERERMEIDIANVKRRRMSFNIILYYSSTRKINMLF